MAKLHMTEAYPFNCRIICRHNRHADEVPNKDIGCHHYLSTSQNDVWETTCAPNQEDIAAFSTETQCSSFVVKQVLAWE